MLNCVNQKKTRYCTVIRNESYLSCQVIVYIAMIVLFIILCCMVK